jgi:PASTA domain
VTGAKLWVGRSGGPANGKDESLSLAVSADATKLFVTGKSDGGSSGFDYATVAYDARHRARGTSCIVPNVRGFRLTTATAKIRRANCVVGKVTHASSPLKKGRVTAQSPKAGTRLVATGKVNLVVSRGPERPLGD